MADGADNLVTVPARVQFVVVARLARLVQEALRVEAGRLAVLRHLGDLLVVKVFEEGHFWDIIIEVVVLDEVSSGALLFDTVTFGKGVFLRGRVSVFATHDGD